MDILRLVLLFVHLLGFAALLGGLLIQARDSEKKVTWLMRDGSGLALVAGIALVGVLEAGDADVNHMKIGIKLVLALVATALVMMNLRKPTISNGVYGAILLATVAALGVAVFLGPVHTF